MPTARSRDQAREKTREQAHPGTRKELERDEKEIGKNIPETMKGLDTEDVGEAD